MKKPTVRELLDRAERMAESAVADAASSDTPASMLRASHKAWRAADLAMMAVLAKLTRRRPRGVSARLLALEDAADAHGGDLVSFDAHVGSAYADVFLQAEERAEFYRPSIVRAAIAEVGAEIVPLARSLVRVGLMQESDEYV